MKFLIVDHHYATFYDSYEDAVKDANAFVKEGSAKKATVAVVTSYVYEKVTHEIIIETVK